MSSDNADYIADMPVFVKDGQALQALHGRVRNTIFRNTE
jgi:hypothetical protein